jgi:hypothetical protein
MAAALGPLVVLLGQDRPDIVGALQRTARHQLVSGAWFLSKNRTVRALPQLIARQYQSCQGTS